MSESIGFDEKVALLLPLYLRGAREMLVKRAENQRFDAARAWTSRRQANWLGEVTAQAASVQDIIKHLEKQGERWADDKASPRFHQTIAQQIDGSLRQKVIHAMQTTARRVAEVLEDQAPLAYIPNDAWIDQEQLALARLYIGALVAWHRIGVIQEG